MRILGIDPGMATTGWGVLEQILPPNVVTLGVGCLLTPAKTPLADRLCDLAGQLRRLCVEYRPDAVAVEELFFAKESRTASAVAHARGVILFVLKELGLPVFEYNPRQVKMALTGYGAADKFQMQHMVQRLLRLTAIPKPDDAADALAIALCHLSCHSLQNALGAAKAG